LNKKRKKNKNTRMFLIEPKSKDSTSVSGSIHAVSMQTPPKCKYFCIKTTKFNMRADCIRKRIKTHINRYILDKLNKILSRENNDLFLFKLPRQLTSDIRIGTNQMILNKTIKELFALKVNDKSEEKRTEHNIKIMEKVKINTFIEFSSRTFKECFLEYKSSSEFNSDLENLKKKEGIKYCQMYLYFIEDFLNYYNLNEKKEEVS